MVALFAKCVFSNQSTDFNMIAKIVPDLHMQIIPELSDEYPLIVKTHSPDIKTVRKILFIWYVMGEMWLCPTIFTYLN